MSQKPCKTKLFN